MDHKTRHCSRISQCKGAESSRWSIKTDKSQMDFLQEVPDPEEILLDSLIYRRPEDEGEDSYQNRREPGSPDNSELDNVLDVILNSSASNLPHLWPNNATSQIHGMPVTSVTTVKTLGEQRTDLGDSRLWLEVKNEITCPLSPKEQDRSGDLDEGAGDLSPVKGGGLGTLTCRHPSLLGLNFISMPVMPRNTVYMSARESQVADTDGYDLRSSPACSSQQMVPYIKQGSSLHLDLESDESVKQEQSEDSLFTTPKETKVSQDYGIPHPNPTSQEHNQFMDFTLCKTETAALYDSFSGSPANMDENPSQTLPTATPPQNHYQSMSYLPQILLPYVQYIRSEDPGQASQFIFDTLPQKPCLICGDEASGCHYGVLTCGSCKVFFKRAVEGQHNYLCAGRNDCIVDKIRRKNCPSCRLSKCCQAGMVLGGRKFKKFNKIKPGREIGTYVIQQSPAADCPQALTQRTSTSSTQEIQFIPDLLQILQSIEPEVVYAGYDNTQPETPSALLCSLNQLCERQLLCVVKWSKSLPGFRNLHIDDQIILLQYSWMSLMVFAMGWRSYTHVSGQMLYFAPDLVLNEQRMKDSSFYSLCLTMQQLPQEFVKLQITHEEFLCMKALLLLNTIPLEGLKSQSLFEEMRSNYIRELAKAVGIRHKGVVASSQRFFHLTKVMDSMHELVKKLHLYCLNTFLQSRALSVEFPEMMTEVISAQLPKILAGMVKQLVFHQK